MVWIDDTKPLVWSVVLSQSVAVIAIVLLSVFFFFVELLVVSLFSSDLFFLFFIYVSFLFHYLVYYVHWFYQLHCLLLLDEWIHIERQALWQSEWVRSLLEGNFVHAYGFPDSKRKLIQTPSVFSWTDFLIYLSLMLFSILIYWAGMTCDKRSLVCVVYGQLRLWFDSE